MKLSCREGLQGRFVYCLLLWRFLVGKKDNTLKVVQIYFIIFS